MLGRLRRLLVQEVPEELSVCMFECPASECSSDTWTECRLRSQAWPDLRAAAHSKSRSVRREEPEAVDGTVELPFYT